MEIVLGSAVGIEEIRKRICYILLAVLLITVSYTHLMFSASLGALLVTAAVFLILYIFYLRLTPKMALLVLLTPIAFFLKIPYVIPIACGLVLSPVSMVAVACGTIVFYMLEYVRENARCV